MARRSFKAGGETMVYDRGRYKTRSNVGSQSTNKQSFFERLLNRLSQPKASPKTKAQAKGLGGALKERQQTIESIDEEIMKQYRR